MRKGNTASSAAPAELQSLEARLLLAADLSQPAGDAASAVELMNCASAVFVQNQGQWTDPSLRYAFDGAGCGIAFRDSGLDFHLFRAADAPTADAPTSMQTASFSMAFDGANTVAPAGEELAETSFNYFLGEQSTWRSDVPGYQVLSYSGLYSGIDLRTWGQRTGLKYEFHVAPGADYQQIQVSYQGIDALSIDEQGALHISTALGDVVEQAPLIYQQVAGQQVEVAGQFVLVDSDTYAFVVTGPYDAAKELVIDPNLAWSTYLGGTGSDNGYGIAVDYSRNILVTGSTASYGWTSGGFDRSYNGVCDTFVAKLSPTGTLLWSTYLGGADSDHGNGIAVDVWGDVLVMGDTKSSGWMIGGFDRSYNGGSYDAFVAKLSSTGGHVWSTYIGGTGGDYGNGIAVDGSGNVLITGYTDSTGWTSGGFDTSYSGSQDAFVAKLSPTGTHLWSTYLGGTGGDCGYGITVDSSGNPLVTGSSSSSGWTSGGFDTSYNGVCDAFVAKLSLTGGYLWSTYLGGASFDYGRSVAMDGSGNILVTGETASSGWTSGGFDTTFNGYFDAFVAKLSPTGGHLWSTYLGGTSFDYGFGVAVDGSGNVLVTGETSSSGWTSGGFDTSYNGICDPFVAKLSPTGGHLWSTYLGGTSEDSGQGIAVDSLGTVLIAGYTMSTGWTSGGFDTSYNGDLYDAFVAKIHAMPGDANFDGLVDVGDLGILGAHYGWTGAVTWSMGDFNSDGKVDVGDLGVLGANYGKAAAGAAIVEDTFEAAGRVAEEFAVEAMASTSEQVEQPASMPRVDRDAVEGQAEPAGTEAAIQQAWLAPLATGSAFGIVEHRGLLGSLDTTRDVLELVLLGLPL